MRSTAVILGIAACMVAGTVHAADKAEILARIESARVGVESFVAKTKNDELVVADVEAARGYLRKAGAAFEGGKQMFGLGGIKPEAEQEIGHCLAMAELNIDLAASRLGAKRNREELAALMPLLDKVKVKVRRFDDREAEMERLRVEAAKADALAREVAQLKADKALLASQIELLMAERKDWEKLKAEQADLARKLQEAGNYTREQAESVPGQSKMAAPESSVGKAGVERAVAPVERFSKERSSPASISLTQPAGEVRGIKPAKQDVPLSELIPLEGSDLQEPVKPEAPSSL